MLVVKNEIDLCGSLKNKPSKPMSMGCFCRACVRYVLHIYICRLRN